MPSEVQSTLEYDGMMLPTFYNNGKRMATLTPGSALSSATTYTVTVKGGAAGVTDVAGNPLLADFTWSFRT